MKNIRHILLLVLLSCVTSCGDVKLLQLGSKVDLIKIEKVELKGLTSLQLIAEVSNASKHDIAMEEGVIELMLDGEHLATLTQIGVVESPAGSHDNIASMWRISNVDPLTMVMLSARFVKQDLDGLSVNYSARLMAGKITRTISGKEVDIKKLLAIFAS